MKKIKSANEIPNEHEENERKKENLRDKINQIVVTGVNLRWRDKSRKKKVCDGRKSDVLHQTNNECSIT